MIPQCIRSVVTHHCRSQSLCSSSLLAAFAARSTSSHHRNTKIRYKSRDFDNNRCFHTTNVVQQQSQQQQQQVDDTPATTIPHHKADIQKMTSKDMIDELRMYGINTQPLFEKHDLFLAVQKAREQQLLPAMNAMTAMKFELAYDHNVTNLDQFLERSELESAFLQHSTSIRSNIEGIVFHNTHETQTLPTSADDTNTDVHKDMSENQATTTTDQEAGSHASATDTNETKEDDDDDDDDDIHTELIHDEMMLCCTRLSVQEMHKEMEQQLRVSPFQLLQSCLAIARVDGIVTRINTNQVMERHRLLPSELWKSMKVQDIVTESFLDPSDSRKSILLPSYLHDDDDGNSKTSTGKSTTSEDTASTSNHPNEPETIHTPSLSRKERIKKEMAGLEKASIKLLFNELENVWGISPRCIYICTIAVLRVLNLVDKERTMDRESSQHESELMNDPEIRSMVDRAMSNPKLDSILSQAIMKPHIRNMVLSYIENPNDFQRNVNDDPEIQKIFANPVFLEQVQQIIAAAPVKK
jgi:hypothetical protein